MKMATHTLWTLSLVCCVLPGISYGQANVGRPQLGPATEPGRPIPGANVPAATGIPMLSPEAASPLDPVPEVLADPTRPLADLPAANRLRPGELPIERLIVTQLQSGALAAAELNQLAAQQALNENVKAFAESVASDQQFFWRALERLRANENIDPPSPGPSLNASQPVTGIPGAAAGAGPLGNSAESGPEFNDFGRPSLTEAERNNPTQLGRTPPVDRQLGQTPLGQTLPDQFPLSQRPPAAAVPNPADFSAADGSDLNAALDAPGRDLGGTLPPAGGESRPTQGPTEVMPAATDPAVVQQGAQVVESAVATAPTALPGGLGELRPLASMADRVAREHLELSIQSLQRHEQEEFDRAFVALQLADRTRSLAELRAMEAMGSNDFREVIARAQEMTVGHLRQAVELARGLDEPTAAAGDQSPAAQ